MNNTKEKKCFKEVNCLPSLSGLSKTWSMSCILTAKCCFRLACDGLQIVESLRY